MGRTRFSGPVRSTGGFEIGSGSTNTSVINSSGYVYVNLTASETKDWGSLASGASATEAVTVTGAALGDFAMASMSLDLSGLTLTAYVSAANTVTVVLANNTAGAVDLASGTLYVGVLKRAS